MKSYGVQKNVAARNFHETIDYTVREAERFSEKKSSG